MIQKNKSELKDASIKKLNKKILKKVNKIETITGRYIKSNNGNEDDEKFIEILARISAVTTEVNAFICIHEDISYISSLARKLTVLYDKTIDARCYCITNTHKKIYKKIESILDLSLYNNEENITTQAKNRLDEIFDKIVEEIMETLKKNRKFKEPWTALYLGEEYTDMHDVWLAAKNIRTHLEDERAFKWHSRWDTLGDCIDVLSKKCIEDNDKDTIETSNQISKLYTLDYLVLIDNVINGNCPLLLAIADTNI